MKLFEIRNSAFAQLKQSFPFMPNYVLKDLVYKNIKDDMQSIDHYIQEYSDIRWRQATLVVTMDIFEPETQQQIRAREGGNSNPNQIKNDAQRHATQNSLISNGPSNEPIIVEQTDSGYELLEGWHRTIQSLKKWPKGYKQAAWVGFR